MKNRRLLAVATLALICASVFAFWACSDKSPSIKRVKSNIVGTWISGAENSKYSKIIFSEDGTYQLWKSSGYTSNWGKMAASGKYDVAMEIDESGNEFPVVVLDSAPYNYKIQFRGTVPMLVNSNMDEVPIERTTVNPWTSN